ncbi:uncharacterized protein BJ171DRAFT_600652 [Polychytrium aggregatum]|uniref:uncharacterized protein n=1 Tax=Polychytrium aggregatum TaxID=110093 RepID=UPI0022FE10BF|nr:uncharacterized protein BJ171DRAFT_600652 [Polychytrium aggregatum]KAI9202633.1 hypothetical protein BJ171DRAFT_600652 [Polychytrium aggregatum]
MSGFGDCFLTPSSPPSTLWTVNNPFNATLGCSSLPSRTANVSLHFDDFTYSGNQIPNFTVVDSVMLTQAKASNVSLKLPWNFTSNWSPNTSHNYTVQLVSIALVTDSSTSANIGFYNYNTTQSTASLNFIVSNVVGSSSPSTSSSTGSPPTPIQTSTVTTSEGLSAGAIAGISVAAVLVAALAALGLIWYHRSSYQRGKEVASGHISAQPSERGLLEHSSLPALPPVPVDQEGLLQVVPASVPPAVAPLPIKATALVDHTGDKDDELDLYKGEDIWIIESYSDGWAKVNNASNEIGIVPLSYLKPTSY